jgi:outer membrane lipoprotein SlyB
MRPHWSPANDTGDRRTESRHEVVGNEIDKKRRQATRYRITVRLDSGSSLIVEHSRDLNLRVGDRVRIADGHIYRI